MAIVAGDRHEEVFSLENFSKGVVYTPGAAESGELSVRSRNFLITPEGHLSFNSGCVGVTPIVCDVLSGAPAYSFWNERFFEHLNRIFYWQRSAGSGVLLACSASLYDKGRIYRFTTGGEHFVQSKLTYGVKMGATFAPSVAGTRGLLWPVELQESELSPDALQVECRTDVFIDFVPYGDYCFVFDGVNAPLLVHPNLTVSKAASPIIGSCLHVRTASYGLLDGVALGSYVYAFVPVLGKLGAGRTGFASDGEDESYVAVSLEAVATKKDGNWNVPCLADLVSPSSHLSTITPLGVEEDATWGGWVFLGNFQPYFTTIPRLSEIQIYRTRRGTAGLFYYVGSVRDGEDSFLDTTPDIALGAELELGKKDPPVARLGVTYQDRLFTVGSMDEGMRNLIRFSERHRPLSFPEDWYIYAPNLLTDDEIVRAVVVRGNLYFLTRRSVLQLVGNTPADYSLVPVSTSVGIVAPRTLAHWRDGVIFLSADGVVYFDPANVESVFTDLSGGMKNYFSSQRRAHRSWEFAAGVASRDYYYLSVSEDMLIDAVPSGRNNKVFALCLRSGGWSEAYVVPFDDACQTPGQRALVSSNMRQGASGNGASYNPPEGGGVYELVPDFPYTWIQGSQTTPGGHDANDPGTGMARLTETTWFDSASPVALWEGMTLGQPDTRKRLERVEVEYVGYVDDAFRLAVAVDQSSTFLTVGPDDPSFEDSPPLQWGVANGSRSAGERRVRKQVFYATMREEGTPLVGKLFSVRLRPAYVAAYGGYYNTWAVVRRIDFYFTTEDVH